MAENSIEKVHQYLDGEAGQPEGGPAEVREIAEYEAIIRETGKLYRSIEVPDLTARITAQLTVAASDVRQETRASRVRLLWSWLWEPRPMRVRPAYGALTAAGLILLLLFPQTNSDTPPGLVESPPSTVATATIFVQFRLDAPQASDVHLVGSFTGWKPAYTLRETTPGIWSVVVPLEPGVHDYVFLVNGEWITDPIAPVVDDGFGGANNRLLVVVPDTSSRL